MSVPAPSEERRIVLFDHDAFARHGPPPGRPHPERPKRLAAARTGLSRLPPDTWRRPEVPLATEDLLLRVHDAAYVRNVLRTLEADHHGWFDADTYYGPGTAEAALRASGASAAAVRAVLEGPHRRGIVLARPPGHHAEPDRAMGFCIFDNVAVAAAEALEAGLERVAIVDFDVHHGNGTQRIFEADPKVAYVSLHESPLYPGTGSVAEVGRGLGRGRTVNVPLPAGSDGRTYHAAFVEIVVPVLERVRPELVLVSAGFDADARDPLAHMRLGPGDFGAMTATLRDVAERWARGRIVAVWEGGYDLDALAEGWEQVARALLGEVPPWSDAPTGAIPESSRAAIDDARRAA
ncbi:MAG: histone deacetylase, partial [Deltaproteobacteria bacterium]